MLAQTFSTNSPIILLFHSGKCLFFSVTYPACSFHLHQRLTFRLDEHNIAKIDALFQGKKETDLMKLPSLNFLSNFGFESAADEQDERASAGEDTKHYHESIASSMSSDSKSRTFSILTNYDLGTASYSGIHKFSKTAPAMLGKRFEEGNNDNLLKKVVPKAPLQTNFAIQTASASAYAANSGVRGDRMVATAPSMQPNVHYREVHREATAQGSSTGKLFQIGSSSPRAPSTEQANQQMLTYDEPIKEGKFLFAIICQVLSILE